MKSMLISLFSIPVVKTNIGREFTKDELQLFNTDIPMSGKVNDDSMHLQSESYNIFDNFAEELKDIKTFCEYELKRYLGEIEGVDIDIVTLQITQSWLNKIEPQEHHALHNHHNSHLSGILYIRCLPNDCIEFTNTDRMYHETLELPKKNITQFTDVLTPVNVVEGDFIIFPSKTLHQVGVNKTKDKQRISLSFDTWPTHIHSLYPPFK